jgi:hypothetical protein
MKTVKLTYPIKIDGVDLIEVTLRRPRVRDRLIIDKMTVSDGEKDVWLIANLAELPKEAVEELDFADYTKILEVLGGFLAPAPEAI